MTFEMRPIGFVRSPRDEVVDDDWGDVVSSIELDASIPADALTGLTDFSHAEILFVFDRVSEDEIEWSARHPRGNTDWPKVGIFAQRPKMRPNRIGSTIVRIEGVDERVLRVRGLDAIDGTPVLDIKPVMQGFLPREAVTEPSWSQELMRGYW